MAFYGVIERLTQLLTLSNYSNNFLLFFSTPFVANLRPTTNYITNLNDEGTRMQGASFTHELSRRDFVRGIAMAALGIASSRFALAQTAFDEKTERSLLAQLLYRLAPSEKFTAAHFERQAAILQQRATRDAALKQNLSNGTQRLNTSGEKPFLELNDDAQIAAMRKQAGSPFWGLMSNPAVGVYNNPEIWPLIGYEGPAFEKGGYLFRGVSDINWLPK
jgi:hypothetical protein